MFESILERQPLRCSLLTDHSTLLQTLGGYQVLKKWLSYRNAPRIHRPLTPDEIAVLDLAAQPQHPPAVFPFCQAAAESHSARRETHCCSTWTPTPDLTLSSLVRP